MFKPFAKKTKEALQRTKDSWFGKVTQLVGKTSLDQATLDELEELLISGDVGMETSISLVERVKERAKRENSGDNGGATGILKDELIKMLKVGPVDENITERASQHIPWVILVVGVNGSGKTTSIAKLAHNFKQDGTQVTLAAADTFRAAAIDQLQMWGNQLGIDVISHQSGADPGAVVFDTIQAAKNRGVEVVIADTAGRLHTKHNLMEELKKIKRVAQKADDTAPHEVLLVMDATTGQNGLSQAKHFTEAVDVTGIILTKLDSTAKGGIVLSICDQLKIPIKYIGTGEKVGDLVPFDATVFVDALMSE